MNLREVGALFLVLLTACSGAPRVAYPRMEEDPSEARLNLTRFLGCDVHTVRFPSWPCFTILEPARRWRELQALHWPGRDGPIIGNSFAKNPPSTVAMTYSAPELAEFCGTTPEAIKALVEKLEGVYY